VVDGRGMFEVILGTCMFVLLSIEAYILFLMKTSKADLGSLEHLDGTLFNIEGKLTLALEKIDDAIEEIHPPTIAESLAQVGSMWMQSKLMDKMQLQPDFNTQLNEPAEGPPEVWPAAEPQNAEPVEV
jgi:hypothetical protein